MIVKGDILAKEVGPRCESISALLRHDGMFNP